MKWRRCNLCRCRLLMILRSRIPAQANDFGTNDSLSVHSSANRRNRYPAGTAGAPEKFRESCTLPLQRTTGQPCAASAVESELSESAVAAFGGLADGVGEGAGDGF